MRYTENNFSVALPTYSFLSVLSINHPSAQILTSLSYLLACHQAMPASPSEMNPIIWIFLTFSVHPAHSLLNLVNGLLK